MAEKPAMNRKAELSAELDRARARLFRAAQETGEDLNVVAHLKHSIVRRKAAWFTGAAVVGWVVSRLPGRRKKPKPEALPKGAHAGLLLAVMSFLFRLFQPLLTSLATRKIGQIAVHGSGGWRR